MAHRQRSLESAEPAEKHCVACGRRIEWRAKWVRDWEAVRYCSDACRRRGVSLSDRMLEASILALLDDRPAGATILVSDAARAVGADRWQELAEPSRRAARRLVVAGQIDMLQHGAVVDASTTKGPFELRRRPR